MSDRVKLRDNMRVNGSRLWGSLMDLAKIGATDKGGVCRLALTDLDRDARDLVCRWAKEAGCDVAVDTMGNIFVRRRGRDNSLAPVATGSHIDTQPSGGKFDGNYGVLAGLEVIRTLNDFGCETLRPIEVVVWTNEEGTRFSPAMVASGVFAGIFDLDYGLSRTDVDGKTLGEELKRIGYAGDMPCGDRPMAAFFETHIEQGPVLEAEGKVIGIVEGVQGIRWYEVTVTGQEAHAGPTPMPRRKDALLGTARMIDAVNRIALERSPYGCATVGMVQGWPNSRNVIPGKAAFSVDLRHPDADVLSAMDRDMRRIFEEIASSLGLSIDVKEIWYSPPVRFSDRCIAAIDNATNDLGYSNRRIVSGAGHDSVYVSKVAPTGMIFVPCKDGISHNEAEDAAPADLEAGCNVLLHAMMACANAA